MKATFVSAAILAAVLGTSAVAQGMGFEGMGYGPMDGMMGRNGGGIGAMMPDFATLDADGDGQVTTAEVDARQAARFAAADTDSSGGLSVEEMIAMAEAMRAEAMAAMMAERLARIDDNADGQVQADELDARMPRAEMMFDMLDTDNSGGISTEEYEAGQAQMGEYGPRGGPRGDDDNGWGFWRHDGGHHRGRNGG